MWTILRLVIGGTVGNRELSVLRALLRRTRALPVYGGQRLRQPVYVLDRADAVLTAAECTEQIGANYNEVTRSRSPSPRTPGSVSVLSPPPRPLSVPVLLAPYLAATGYYERLSRHADSGRAVLP